MPTQVWPRPFIRFSVVAGLIGCVAAACGDCTAFVIAAGAMSTGTVGATFAWAAGVAVELSREKN